MNWRTYIGLFLAAATVLAPPGAGAHQGTVLAHRSLGEDGPSAPAGAYSSLVDLTRATIVTPSTLTVPERTAVRVLVEEIERRTTVRLPVASHWPNGTIPVIGIGPLATASSWAAAGLRNAAPARAPGAEGVNRSRFHTAATPSTPGVSAFGLA